MDLLQISFDGIQVGEINFPAAKLSVPTEHADGVERLVKHVYDAGKALKAQLDLNVTQGAKLDDANAKVTEQKEKLDSVETFDDDAKNAWLQGRIGLERTAAFFKVKTVGAKGVMLTDSAVMQACLIAKHGEAVKTKLDSATDEGQLYIRARYDSLAEEAEAAGAGFDQLTALGALQTVNLDNLSQFTGDPPAKPGDTPKKDRATFMKMSQDAHKNPQPSSSRGATA